MQNAKKEMCNLISYTKIEGFTGWGIVRSRLKHVTKLDRDQNKAFCMFFFFIIFYNQTCFTIKNRMVGECYEIYNFFILFDITIIFMGSIAYDVQQK